MENKDKNWLKYYNLAKEYFENNGDLLVPNDYKMQDIKLGSWIVRQRKNYKKKDTDKANFLFTQERIEKLEAIGMVWDPLEVQWQEMYQLAKQYFENNGHLLIPNNYETENGLKLGGWISVQRYNYRKKNTDKANSLFTQERIEKLEAIGMVWNTLEVQWQEYYNLAKQYFENNGHLLVPRYYKTEEGLKLGNWIGVQRQDYKYRNTDKANSLFTQERIEKLEAIGMVWDCSIMIGTSFPEYLIYYYFKSIYGEDNVLYRDKSLGFELDVYIPHLNIAIEYDGPYHKNRKKYDEEKNKLCQKENITLFRIREKGLPILNKNDFIKIFNIDKYSSYEDICNKIIDIFKQPFIFDIIQIYNEYAITTMSWLDNQWQKKYQLAKEYYKRNGNLLVPWNYPILGMWIINQRKNYKNTFLNKKTESKRIGMLSKERIEELEAIGMVWDPLEAQWQEMYQLAKQYYKDNSHLLIPNNYETEDGLKLGSWIWFQRYNYKHKNTDKASSLFTQEKIDLLEGIGMVWDPLEAQWQEMYQLAKQYYKDNRNLLVPYDYEAEDTVKLGNWISRQRRDYKKKNTDKANSLFTQERIDLLEAIGMVWNVHKVA